jgi:translation initiation factor IF-3
LIDDEGTMLGIYSSQDALQVAQDKGLDLIEIAPNANPPTCKIMDYGKWKYENKKKQVASRKKQAVVSIKEVQLRVRTDQHDLDVKMRNARKFLLKGDKVKVNLRFYGREMAHQELGVELLNKVTKVLDDVANVEAPPKKEGRQLFVLLSPDATKIKEYGQKAKSDEASDLPESSESKADSAST